MAQDRKIYNFSSVGELNDSFQKNFLDEKKDFPIGFKTPVQMGDEHNLFAMHTDLGKQIADNFRNMLRTNNGERLNLYDFGANLEELAFELSTNQADTEAIKRIKRTTEKYMGYIQLETFEPIVENSTEKGIATVGVKITYSVPKINLKNQVVEAIIYSAG